MKVLLFASIVLFTTSGMAQEKPRPITLNELRQRGVEGELGLPLGTVCEIEGRIVDAGDDGPKRLWSTYLLKVHTINGVPVEGEKIFEFRNSDEDKDTSLPRKHFGMYKQIYKKPARWLNGTRMTEDEKSYVGSSHRRFVYESGRYSGLPRNMPGLQRAGFDFEFFNELVVLSELPEDRRGK